MKVVGIGASAGGINALKRFLGKLSPNTGAAYVIVQHLSPDFKSIMEDLLRPHSSMPIQQIQKNEVVEADHIYLMPSNKTITYYQGVLVLHDRPSGKNLNLPIDDFFHSLGEELRSEAIGIILSGSGTDGSRGARTIKEKEGIVLVQSPDSAEFDGMPNALIQLDIADEILNPEDLAEKVGKVIELNNYFTEKNGGLQKNPNDPQLLRADKSWFEKIIELTSAYSGVPFQTYKVATLKRRIEKQMALNHCETLEVFYDFLKKDEKHVDVLYRDFLINVTQFFRDEDLFAEVAEMVIPKVFAEVKAGSLARVWVAACSTGEEAYSLGILMLEYLEQHKLKHDFKIFASDVNKNSIAFAAQGLYNSSILAAVPKHFIQKYFNDNGEYYRVKTFLREKIIFAVHDVITDPPFINMNLISCRNFLIYLQPQAQQKILKTFYFSLKRNQFLVLGPSESLGELNAVFTNLHRKQNIFIKENVDYQTARQRFNPPAKLWNQKAPQLATVAQDSMKGKEKNVKLLDNPFTEFLVQAYAPKSLFLTRELDILYMTGNFESILSLPQAVTELNLEKMLPKKHVLFFRDALRATWEEDSIHFFRDIAFEKKGKITLANVRLEKINFPEIENPVIHVQIEYEKEKEGPHKAVKESEFGSENYNQARILRLEDEVTRQQEEMSTLRQQLEMTNEELNSSNRELLQSNQELQSINEELHTVNSELQHKNKELQLTNNDVNNLLKTTNIGTIFLDEKLRIRKFTKAITRRFDIIHSDIGRSIRSFNNQIEEKELSELCEQVLANKEPYEIEISDKNNRIQLLRIFPYVTKQEVEGIVITLIDVHERFQVRQHQLEEQEQKFKSFINEMDITLLTLNSEGIITSVNHPFDNFEAKSLPGHKLGEILTKESQKTLKEAIAQIDKNKEEVTIEVSTGAEKRGNQYTFKINPVLDSTRAGKDISYLIAALPLNFTTNLF